MNKKQIFLIIPLLFLAVISFCQEAEVKWSPLVKYDNDGYWRFLNSTSNKILLEKKKKSSDWKSIKSLKVFAYDGETLNQNASLPILGFKENKAQKKKYKKLSYWKTFAFKKGVIVLWIKREGEELKIYGETFDENMSRKSEPMEFATVSSQRKLDKATYLNVLVNEGSGTFLICSELAGKKGENVMLDLQLYSMNFQSVSSFQVELPLIIEGRKQRLNNTSFLLGDDNAFHFEDKRLTEVEEKLESSRSRNVGAPLLQTFGSVDLATKKVTCTKLTGLGIDGVATYEKIVSKDGVYFVGFSASSKNDEFEKHKKINGVFYIKTDKYYNVVNKKNNSFSSDDIAALFANQPYSEPEMVTHNVKNPDFFSGEYKVENAKRFEDGNIYLISSRNHVKLGSVGSNWTYSYSPAPGQSTLSQTNVVSSTFFNVKTGALIFKLNSKGELEWNINVPRRKLYSAIMQHSRFKTPEIYFERKDIHILEKGDRLFVLTADEYDINEKGEAVVKTKKVVKKKQPLRIFSIDKKTGEYTTSEINMNGDGSEKRSVQVIDFKSTGAGFIVHAYKGNSLKQGFVGKIRLK